LKVVIPKRGFIAREPALSGVEGNLLFARRTASSPGFQPGSVWQNEICWSTAKTRAGWKVRRLSGI